jgi:hypothetical protein
VLRSDRNTPHGGHRVREDASAEQRKARTCPRWSVPRASPPSAGASSPRGNRHLSPFGARAGSPPRARTYLPIPRRNRPFVHFKAALPRWRLDQTGEGSRRLSGTRPPRGAQVPPRPRCQAGGGAMKEKEAELLTYRLATRGGTCSVCPYRRRPSLERRLRQPGCPSSRACTTCVASARTVRALGFASQPLSWFALIVSSFGARECTYEVALRQTGRARFSA